MLPQHGPSAITVAAVGTRKYSGTLVALVERLFLCKPPRAQGTVFNGSCADRLAVPVCCRMCRAGAFCTFSIKGSTFVSW